MIRGNVTFLLLLFCAENIVAEDKIYRACVSESGDSIYDIELNRSLGVGEVRYRFFGQDVFYKVTVTSGDAQIVEGVAEFQSSRSGEVRGNPWIFRYDPATDVLMDNKSARACK